MPAKLRRLEWDSHFFGMPVGEIILESAASPEIGHLLAQARKEQYRLLYVFTPGQEKLPKELLNSQGGRRVAGKCFYAGEVAETEKAPDRETAHIRPIRILSPDLEQLALLSGSFSRFNTDPGFSPGSFERLYQTWIARSVSGEIADAVYGVFEQEQLAGMATISWKSKTARIGLLALLPEGRGRGLGNQLLARLGQECRLRGLQTLEVATQEENRAACRFYEKNGFRLLSRQQVYHFWLI